MTGAAREPLESELEQMLAELGLHNSYFTRKAAFDKLFKLVGRGFDPNAAEL